VKYINPLILASNEGATGSAIHDTDYLYKYPTGGIGGSILTTNLNSNSSTAYTNGAITNGGGIFGINTVPNPDVDA